MSDPLHCLVPTQILDDLKYQVTNVNSPKCEKKKKLKKSKIKLSPTQALTDFSNLISSRAVSV